MAKRNHPRPRERHQPAPSTATSGHGGQWLYGTHAVRAAWLNPRRSCRRLIVTEQAAEHFGPTGNFGLPPVGISRPGPEIAERQHIERHLPPGSVHQGMALLVDPLPDPAIETLCLEWTEMTAATVIVLDRAEDPHNVGAVLRSAAAFGAQAVILPDRHAPNATAALAKVASGALETVPLVRVTNLARALGQLKQAGFWCIGFDMAADALLAAADIGGKAALVLGSEGDGLRRLTRASCDLLVRIPLVRGGIESLNLSAAAAIALYERARDR
jgi:23S rRNA (guanosine2251-2'-O)-methyltransferase